MSRVIASTHKKGRVYASLNGYRLDDFKAYVYVSEDDGKTWKSISSNLPFEAVNVIKEDPANENLLYVGTDNGVYVSLDRGANWDAFSKGLPNVAVHDLVIQATAKELVIGTHGRSIYKTNIAPLQQLNASLRNKAVHLFEITPVRFSPRWGQSFSQWRNALEPSVTITTYAKEAKNITVTIVSKDGTILQSIETTSDKGFNYVPYDLTVSDKGRKQFLKNHKKTTIKKASNGKYYLPKGTYTVKVSNKEIFSEQLLRIK